MGWVDYFFETGSYIAIPLLPEAALPMSQILIFSSFVILHLTFGGL